MPALKRLQDVRKIRDGGAHKKRKSCKSRRRPSDCTGETNVAFVNYYRRKSLVTGGEFFGDCIERVSWIQYNRSFFFGEFLKLKGTVDNNFDLFCARRVSLCETFKCIPVPRRGEQSKRGREKSITPRGTVSGGSRSPCASRG